MRTASRLRARALGWFNDRSDGSLAGRVASAAFIIRVFSAGLIYLSQIFLARWMGSFQFGIYVYVWTLVAMVGDLADLGFGTAAQRFVPEYVKRGSFDLLRGFISRSRWFATGSACIVSATGLIAVHLLQQHMQGYFLLPLSVACATLPFYTLMQMQDGIARSYDWIVLALLPPFVMRHIIMLTLVVTAALLGLSASAETAVVAVAAALALTVIGQAVLLNRRLRQTVPAGPKAYATRTWLATSLPIFVAESFLLLLTNADIVMLQQFRPPDDVAVYYAAAKTLALVAFVHFAVTSAVGHRFSKYHVSGDRERLKTLLADSIRWMFWASLGATAILLALGGPLLSLFGAQFTGGYHLMVILSVGLLARSACGPVERLLNMLGEQRACAAVYAVAFAINVLLCAILIPRLGIDGAAIATSTALVSESIMLFAVTRRRLGLHVFILGRPQQHSGNDNGERKEIRS